MLRLFKSVFLALLAVLVILAGAQSVNAQKFIITSVELDDILLGTDPIFVERESTAKLEIFLKGNTTSDKVRVEAWIGGYEYGRIDDESEIFEVEPNVTYRKTLTLEIPEDLDANDDYTLHVEVSDDDNNVEKEFKLRVQEIRHRLDVLDVLLSPGSNLEAGDNLFVTVRLENLGAKKEEDIKVTASIRDLGVSTSTYIDELTAEEDPDEDEETSMSSDDLFLEIPEDAKEGLYKLDVVVEYNRGRTVLTETMQVFVKEEDKDLDEDEKDEVKVPEKEPVTPTTPEVKEKTSTRDILIISFIVLVIVLIILGLIIAFQRMRGPEEPDEGTKYY